MIPFSRKATMKIKRYVKFSGYTACLLSLVFILAFVGSFALADTQAARVTQLASPEVECSLWSIDTRTAVCRRGTPLAEAGIRVFKKVDGCWQDTSREELAAVDKNIPLVVFFHGMWLNQAEGREEGMQLYRCLKQHASGRPFQFVIWSWPAMKQQCGPRRDIHTKMARTDTQAFYVAQWLDTLPEDRPICLIGYSLGARVVSGSLELMGGGTICGQSLESVGLTGPAGEVRVLKGPEEVRVLEGPGEVRVLKGPGETQGESMTPVVPRRSIRAALVAAAIDSGSFLPGHQNGQALSQVERILVTRNSRDHVLRWYPMLYRGSRPRAMGFAGPACSSRLGPDGDRLEVLPVSCSVGRQHYWKSYLRSCTLRAELSELALEPSSASTGD